MPPDVSRALQVVCVAPDREPPGELKRATVGTDWELTPGALSATEAVAQIEDRSAHIVVVSGPSAREVVAAIRDRWPWMRIVVVGSEPVEGASVLVGSLHEVREAVKGLPSPGGPVRGESFSVARASPVTMDAWSARGFWPPRAGIARGWSARSRPSSRRWR